MVVVPQVSSTLFFETGSHILQLAGSATLLAGEPYGSAYLCLPSVGFVSVNHHQAFLYVSSGDQTQVPKLVRQTFAS